METISIKLSADRIKAKAGQRVKIVAALDVAAYVSVNERREKAGYQNVTRTAAKVDELTICPEVHEDTTDFIIMADTSGVPHLNERQNAVEAWYHVEVVDDPQPVPEPTGKLLYKVGLISDVHMDVEDSHNSEYKTDLMNALQYFTKEGCEFVSCAGDFVQYNDQDYDVFKEWYNVYGYARNRLRLFTCLGNHDYLRMFSIRQPSDKYVDDGALYNYIGMWGNVSCFHNLFEPVGGKYEADLHFFEHGARWDCGYKEGWRSSKSKMCYWTERHGDFYVYLSIDYGTMVYGDPWDTLARGINRLDYDDEFVQQMTEYVKDVNYNRERETNFDYRFYEPEALIWLKGLIEDNPTKRVFVFMHHPFPHKAGDSDGIYSHLRVWPVPTSAAIKQKYYSGSNTLCGLTFWFLDKLNNQHKNVMFFTGHTHREWTEGVSVCKHDYPIRKPTGTEVTPLVDDLNTLDGTEYDYRLYQRASQQPCGDCGTCVGLPSLSKPVNGDGVSMYGGSQGGVLEVYEDGMVLSCVVFKDEGDSSYTNREVMRVTL